MELLEAVGLGDAAGARPGELSGGQQQRVALCAALAHRPKLLLADEPSGELDAANAAEVYRLIRELAADVGGTAVIVSHDPGSEAIADRVVRVRDGRLSQETLGDGEALVVGRGGWVHVPADLLDGATHLRAHRDEDGVVLETAARRDLPADEQPPDEPPVPGAVVAELVSVRKAFGARTVFDAFSAGFHRGLLTTIAGRSGTGKSTLRWHISVAWSGRAAARCWSAASRWAGSTARGSPRCGGGTSPWSGRIRDWSHSCPRPRTSRWPGRCAASPIRTPRPSGCWPTSGSRNEHRSGCRACRRASASEQRSRARWSAART